jgi:hypothetical protein
MRKLSVGIVAKYLIFAYTPNCVRGIGDGTFLGIFLLEGNSMIHISLPSRQHNFRSKRPHNKRPMGIEMLEDRRVLAVVSNLGDSGAGTLRDALAGTDALITFSVSGLINLTSGELLVNRNVTINGAGQNVTVNNAVAGNRVFNIDDSGGTADLNVTIRDLVITGGSVAHNNPVDASGGGIRNAERLTLVNTMISGNSAGIGGGIANVSGGILNATSVSVTQNAAYYSGGGISVSSSSSATLNSNTVSSNTVGLTNASTFSSFGGGIFNAGTLVVSGGTISNNQSKHTDLANRSALGGGVASTGTASTTISGTTISGNHADEQGGGISGTGGATIHELTNVMVNNNDAGLNATGVGRGGGVYISGAQTGSMREVPRVTISGGSFANNIAQNGPIGVATTGLGGGLFLGINVEGSIDAATVSGNTAFTRGGGIWLSNFTAQGDLGAFSKVTIRNTTITGNSIPRALSPTATALFPYGGGVYQAINVNLTIVGSTISNNRIGESTALQGNARGGGLFARAINGTVPTRFSRMTIVNSTVSGNESRDIAASGGGIHLSQGAEAKIYGSTISNNYSNGGNSGGIGMIFDQPRLTIVNSRVLENRAKDDPAATTQRAFGGGIGANVGSVTIRRSEITGNTGDWGGGLGLRAPSVVIEDSRITGNSSTSVGGGVEIRRRASVVQDITVRNTTISGNTSGTATLSTSGGGAFAPGVYSGSESGTVNLTVTGSTLDDNESPLDGGAIEANGTNLVIENSTLAGNRAAGGGGSGGAIWFTASSTGVTGSLDVRFSTLSGNSAGSLAGAIWNNGPVFTMSNSIMSGNTAISYLDSYSPSYGTITYSLVEDPNGNTSGSGIGNITGVSANLGPLQNNGGATATMLPNAGSPVLNAADPAATLVTDQRRYARPGANASRDMGSVEPDGTAPGIDGDFNNDGSYDCMDMNALSTAVATGGSVAMFDLTGDNALTIADMDAWRLEAGQANFGPGRSYKTGDANLDGLVDKADFDIWFAARFTTNAQWCSGNFNGDLVVDGQDFNIWNNSNGMTTFDNLPSTARTGNQPTVPQRIFALKGPGTQSSDRKFKLEPAHEAVSEQGSSAVEASDAIAKTGSSRSRQIRITPGLGTPSAATKSALRAGIDFSQGTAGQATDRPGVLNSAVKKSVSNPTRQAPVTADEKAYDAVFSRFDALSLVMT